MADESTNPLCLNEDALCPVCGSNRRVGNTSDLQPCPLCPDPRDAA